jgi:hypothetical protein
VTRPDRIADQSEKVYAEILRPSWASGETDSPGEMRRSPVISLKDVAHPAGLARARLIHCGRLAALARCSVPQSCSMITIEAPGRAGDGPFATENCGRDTGYPIQQGHRRQCSFPALRSSEVDSQHRESLQLLIREIQLWSHCVFGDARYERLATVSVAHLYNLRQRAGY